MKKIFTFLVAFLAIAGNAVWGQDSETGDFTVSGNGTYEFKSNTLTVSAGEIAISTTKETNNKIVIDGGTSESPINITLNTVKLKGSSGYSSIIEVERNSNAAINLKGVNIITTAYLEIGQNATLSIKGAEKAELIIDGAYGIYGDGDINIENADISITSSSIGIDLNRIVVDGSKIKVTPKNSSCGGIKGKLSVLNSSIISAIVNTSVSSVEETNRDKWNGIVIEDFKKYISDNAVGIVYGSVTLKETLNFRDWIKDPQDLVFVIPEKSSLQFENNAKITTGSAKVCYGKGHEDLSKSKVTSTFGQYYQIIFEKPTDWDNYKEDKDTWEEPADAIEYYKSSLYTKYLFGDKKDKSQYKKEEMNYILKVPVGNETLVFGSYSQYSDKYIALHLGNRVYDFSYDQYSYDEYEIESFTASYGSQNVASVKDQSYESYTPSFKMPNEAVTIKDIKIKQKEYDLILDFGTWIKPTYYNDKGEKITEAAKDETVYFVLELSDELKGVAIMNAANSSKKDDDGIRVPNITWEILKSHLTDVSEELKDYRVPDIEHENAGTRYVYKITMPDFTNAEGREELLWTTNASRLNITYYTVTVADIKEGGKVLVKDEKLTDLDPEPAFATSLEKIRGKETITIQVEVENRYELASLYYEYDDTKVNIEKNEAGDYIFVMPSANVTVYAEFTKIPYYITIGDMTNGSLKLEDEDVIEYEGRDAANAGSEITVTPEPFEGYKLQKGSLQYAYTKDGEIHTEPISNLTFTMPEADITLIAKFIPVGDYVVTVSDNIENGKVTIEPDGVKTKVVKPGEKVELAIAPDEGYELSSVTYIGDDGISYPIEGTSFTMPESDVTINAEFVWIPIDDDDDEESSSIPQKRYRLYLADQDFYLNDEYDEAGLVLYSRHDKKYTDVGGSFTVWFEKNGEVNEGARVFISNRANGEYKEVKLDEVSGYYQIRNVQSNIYVKLYTEEGFPVANESIEATDARAYAQANKIVVITPEPTDVQIISMAGAVVATAQVAGQQEFANLTEGVYIVRMGEDIVKLQVRN